MKNNKRIVAIIMAAAIGYTSMAGCGSTSTTSKAMIDAVTIGGKQYELNNEFPFELIY